MKIRRQFTVYFLFQLTAVFALLFTLTAPLVRAAFEKSDQPKFLAVYALVQFAIFVLVAFRAWSKRKMIQTHNGRLTYRTSIHTENELHEVSRYDLLAMSVVVAYGVLLASPQTQSWMSTQDGAVMLILSLHPFVLLLQYSVFSCAARACLSLMFDLDQYTIEVYESGFCYNIFRFQTWDDVKLIRVPKHWPNKIEIVYDDGSMQGAVVKTIKVRRAKRDEVAAAMTKSHGGFVVPNRTRPISTTKFSSAKFGQA